MKRNLQKSIVAFLIIGLFAPIIGNLFYVRQIRATELDEPDWEEGSAGLNIQPKNPLEEGTKSDGNSMYEEYVESGGFGGEEQKWYEDPDNWKKAYDIGKDILGFINKGYSTYKTATSGPAQGGQEYSLLGDLLKAGERTLWVYVRGRWVDNYVNELVMTITGDRDEGTAPKWVTNPEEFEMDLGNAAFETFVGKATATKLCTETDLAMGELSLPDLVETLWGKKTPKERYFRIEKAQCPWETKKENVENFFEDGAFDWQTWMRINRPQGNMYGVTLSLLGEKIAGYERKIGQGKEQAAQGQGYLGVRECVKWSVQPPGRPETYLVEVDFSRNPEGEYVRGSGGKTYRKAKEIHDQNVPVVVERAEVKSTSKKFGGIKEKLGYINKGGAWVSLESSHGVTCVEHRTLTPGAATANAVNRALHLKLDDMITSDVQNYVDTILYAMIERGYEEVEGKVGGLLGWEKEQDTYSKNENDYERLQTIQERRAAYESGLQQLFSEQFAGVEDWPEAQEALNKIKKAIEKNGALLTRYQEIDRSLHLTEAILTKTLAYVGNATYKNGQPLFPVLPDSRAENDKMIYPDCAEEIHEVLWPDGSRFPVVDLIVETSLNDCQNKTDLEDGQCELPEMWLPFLIRNQFSNMGKIDDCIRKCNACCRCDSENDCKDDCEEEFGSLDEISGATEQDRRRCGGECERSILCKKGDCEHCEDGKSTSETNEKECIKNCKQFNFLQTIWLIAESRAKCSPFRLWKDTCEIYKESDEYSSFPAGTRQQEILNLVQQVERERNLFYPYVMTGPGATEAGKEIGDKADKKEFVPSVNWQPNFILTKPGCTDAKKEWPSNQRKINPSVFEDEKKINDLKNEIEILQGLEEDILSQDIDRTSDAIYRIKEDCEAGTVFECHILDDDYFSEIDDISEKVNKYEYDKFLEKQAEEFMHKWIDWGKVH